MCVEGVCVCVLVGSTLGAAGPNWKLFLRGPRFTAKVCRIVEIKKKKVIIFWTKISCTMFTVLRCPYCEKHSKTRNGNCSWA